MDALPTSPGEIMGISGVVLAFLAIFWKMYAAHNKLADKVTNALIENAKVNASLVGSIEKNTESTKANTQVTLQTKETFTLLLSELIKK